MNTKSIVLFVLLMTSLFQSFAQKDYAILAKGDTLTGEIKFYSFDNVDRLQITNTGKKSNYTALQVRGFKKGGDTYQSVNFDRSFRFMKVIKSGYLSLFAFNIAGQGSWDGRYLGRKDGTGMEVPNLAFKKFLSKYLDDCPEVSGPIAQGKLVKRDIERIVDQYNACLQAKTETLVKSITTPPSSNEVLVAIAKLKEKVEAENFLTKKDVTDLLQDIQKKVAKNEEVPNYLTEGLKSYLADTPALLKDAEHLISLLKK